jgi:FkbM family methyltransferase
MQENASSMKRALQEGLITDPTNFNHLYELWSLCKATHSLMEAKFYYSKALEVCSLPETAEKIKLELLGVERSIQFDSPKLRESEPDFLDLLVKELLENSKNQHYYNIDIELFEFMRVLVVDCVVVSVHDERRNILKHLYGIAELYECLADRNSREMLIKILAFRILGNKKVMLPLNSPDYWSKRQAIRNMIVSPELLKTVYHQWDLHFFNLQPLGYDIRLYCFPIALSATYVDKQYAYESANLSIKANTGDIVLDVGGCFGDTALYFAHEVGANGHVYTVEFIPSNLEIMKTNLNNNPRIKDNITMVEYPVWNCSGQSIYYTDQGPASYVSLTKTAQACEETVTISIEDMVKRYNIPKVDFIKMDVEGAELHALQGARETIEACRPKLAVTIYHQLRDFEEIVRYITSLQLGYKFYLGHYTIYAQETVLFAVSTQQGGL